MAPTHAQIRSAAMAASLGAEALMRRIDSLTDAPQRLRTLHEALKAMHQCIDDLKNNTEEQWTALGAPLTDLAHASFKLSLEIMADLNKSLWTKSEDGQQAVALRVVANDWRQKRIDGFHDALWSCQEALDEIGNVASLDSFFTIGGHAKEIEQILADQDKSLENFARVNEEKYFKLHDLFCRSLEDTDHGMLDQQERQDVRTHVNSLVAEMTLVHDGEKLVEDVRGKLKYWHDKCEDLAKGGWAMVFSGDAKVAEQIAKDANSEQGP